jgi:hypothetical protein
MPTNEPKGWPFDGPEETPVPRPSPATEAPIPALWQRIEERLGAKIEAALAGAQREVTPADIMANDPVPLLNLLVRIEMDALNVAREEMRLDGIHPSVPAGLQMTLDLAKPISRYLRGRLGIALDPEGK